MPLPFLNAGGAPGSLWPVTNLAGTPYALSQGVGGIPFASILSLSPELAFSAKESGACFQERTGAGATTPSGVDGVVGSLRNFGTKGGWLTAPTDAARPIFRASAALRYLEADGLDDVLSGSLGALRAVAGWTLIFGVRNTGSTATARNVIFITSGAGNSRAGYFFATTSGDVTLAGRRASADGAAVASAGPHSSTDYTATGISDYTNTDAFLRADGVQEGQNTTWLTAGLSDNDAGAVQLFAGLGPGGFLPGRLYSLLAFGSVLSPADLNLAERWTAEQMGMTL